MGDFVSNLSNTVFPDRTGGATPSDGYVGKTELNAAKTALLDLRAGLLAETARAIAGEANSVNPAAPAVNSAALVQATGASTSKTLAEHTRALYHAGDTVVSANGPPYNAKGDATWNGSAWVGTDNTAAIQAAMTAAAGGAAIVTVGKGRYILNGPLTKPLGVSFLGAGVAQTVFVKNHTGSGIIVNNAGTYDDVSVGGFDIVSPGGRDVQQTGIALDLRGSVRVNYPSIGVEDIEFGIVLDNSISNEFGRIRIDRCKTGILTKNGSHFNVFRTLIGAGPVVGGVPPSGSTLFQINDAQYATRIDSIDAEYWDYPIVFRSGARGVEIGNAYFEWNWHGARLEAGARNIAIRGSFASGNGSGAVPVIDAATFGASNVSVDNVTLDYPSGLGAVTVNYNGEEGSFGNVSRASIWDGRMRRQPASFSVGSSWGISGGSVVAWSGPAIKNLVANNDLSNAGQWPGGNGTVTANAGAIWGLTSYTFSPNRYSTHVASTGAAMASRSFVGQAYAKGQAGSVLRVTVGDNVTGQTAKDYTFTDTGWHLVYLVTTWGVGSTNPSYAFTFENRGTTSIDVVMPVLTEGVDAIPGMLRTAAQDGYWSGSYGAAEYFNLGRNVRVYGTTAPTTGAWVAGDEIEFSGAAAGAAPGARCVASGTPGTWKAKATLAP